MSSNAMLVERKKGCHVANAFLRFDYSMLKIARLDDAFSEVCFFEMWLLLIKANVQEMHFWQRAHRSQWVQGP